MRCGTERERGIKRGGADTRKSVVFHLLYRVPANVRTLNVSVQNWIILFLQFVWPFVRWLVAFNYACIFMVLLDRARSHACFRTRLFRRYMFRCLLQNVANGIVFWRLHSTAAQPCRVEAEAYMILFNRASRASNRVSDPRVSHACRASEREPKLRSLCEHAYSLYIFCSPDQNWANEKNCLCKSIP